MGSIITIIVIAVVGWLLFLFTGLLYWVGNRVNAEESNSLAVLGLASILSDNFRESIKGGFEAAIGEARARRTNHQVVANALLAAIRQMAKSHYKPDSDSNTISIVMSILKEDK